MTELNELAKALSAAQGEMENAKMNGTNPHFNSKFANLAAIREATLPALTKHGLAITQFTTYTDTGTLLLVTRLMHASGQYVEGEFPIAIGKPQEMGSALTYAKRYSWSGITGVAADEDDDGQSAQTAPSKAAKRTPAPAAEAPEGGTPGKDDLPPAASVESVNGDGLTSLRAAWYTAGKDATLTDPDLLAYVESKHKAAGTKDLNEDQLRSDIEVFKTLKTLTAKDVKAFKQELAKVGEEAPF